MVLTYGLKFSVWCVILSLTICKPRRFPIKLSVHLLRDISTIEISGALLFLCELYIREFVSGSPLLNVLELFLPEIHLVNFTVRFLVSFNSRS